MGWLGDKVDAFLDSLDRFAERLRKVWEERIWPAIDRWVDKFADVLKTFSEVLKWIAFGAAVLAVVALFVFPPAAAVLGAIALGIGAIALGVDALLAATGNGSWTDVGVEALFTFVPFGKILKPFKRLLPLLKKIPLGSLKRLFSPLARAGGKLASRLKGQLGKASGWIPQAAEFKKIFKDFFPSRSRETALSKAAEMEAARRIRPLVTEAENLLDELEEWGAATGIKALSRESIDETLQTRGYQLWREAFQGTQAKINAIISRFSYQGSSLEYLGSMKTGLRGAHKGKTYFDANEFDVDLYVVNADEFDRAVRNNPTLKYEDKIFPTIEDTPELFRISREVGKALAKAFPDVRGIGESEIVLRRTPPR
ncbi:MAG: hypothetical protein ACRDYA_12570 [Egibacteraceae bacterium]